MRYARLLTIGVVAAVLTPLAASAQDVTATLREAAQAIGAEGLRAIRYTGSATTVPFGQTYNASGPWRGNPIIDYVRVIDLAEPASRATGTVTATSLFVGGTPLPGPYNQRITPANAAWAQQLELWITPWGFLKGAAVNGATVRTARSNGKTYRVVTWSPPQRARSGAAYAVSGYIDDQGLIEKVETAVENDLIGDLRIEQSYEGWRDLGGVKVPSRIVQKRLGWPTFTATITGAAANPDGAADFIRQGPGPTVFPVIKTAPSEKIADGVWRLPGAYVALAVEMDDHVIVLEGGGDSPQRGREVMAETRRLIPGKPIRYVMSTHPHSDHTARLAPYVAEGITIVTHANNRAFLEAALGNSRTLVGDELAQSRARPKILTVTGKRVFGGGSHPVEIHALEGVRHSDGFLVAYLPKERLLFQGDFSIPPTGADPSRPNSGVNTNEFVYQLVDNLDRLNLWAFDRMVPVHPPTPDAPWTRADLLKAVGRPADPYAH